MSMRLPRRASYPPPAAADVPDTDDGGPVARAPWKRPGLPRVTVDDLERCGQQPVAPRGFVRRADLHERASPHQSVRPGAAGTGCSAGAQVGEEPVELAIRQRQR